MALRETTSQPTAWLDDCPALLNEGSHQLRRPDKRSLPELFRIHPWIGPKKVAENAALIGVGAVLALGCGWPLAVLGCFIVGLGLARNLELTHETLHRTLFQRRSANRLAGTPLAIPMGVSWTLWRFTHMQHHNDVTTEGFSYQLERLAAPNDWFQHALMVAHWRDVARRVWMAVRWDLRAMRTDVSNSSYVDPARVPDDVVSGALLDHLGIVCYFAMVTGVLFAYPTAIPAIICIYLAATMIHTAIELPEHLGTDVTSNDGLRNSRYVRANRFVSWVVNDNNRHAHHHWVESAPVGNLRLLDAMVEKHGMFVTTYSSFFSEVLVGAWARWIASRKSR